MLREYEFKNARPEHVASQTRFLRWELTIWLIALPITIPLTAMIVVIECWDTIEAIIRLVHHQ